MPLPYDDFKKTEKLNSINSPPQEQPKENALQGGMGDAQKLKITSDATKKFKQMYLKMLATRSDAVSENLSEEKPEEHYISLDCKTKTESHSSFIPQKKPSTEAMPLSKDAQKISGKHPVLETKDTNISQNQELPTAKGILDKWKTYRQKNSSQQEVSSSFPDQKAQEETEILSAEKFLGISSDEKPVSMPAFSDPSVETKPAFSDLLIETNIRTEKRAIALDEQAKTASRKPESIPIPESVLSAMKESQKHSETRELPLPIGRVANRTTSSLYTQKRTIISRPQTESNAIEQEPKKKLPQYVPDPKDSQPTPLNTQSVEEKPKTVIQGKVNVERWKFKKQSEREEEKNALNSATESKIPAQQPPMPELATADMSAQEFLMDMPDPQAQNSQLATADMSAQEFLMDMPDPNATADLPQTEGMAQKTMDMSTKEWKRTIEQGTTDEIASLLSKGQKKGQKPADIDLTVAAKEGEFDPIPKKASQNFSWESLLSNKTIDKECLISSVGNEGGLDSIKINRLLGRGANGEVYEVECKRFYPYKYALKIPLMPLAKNGPIFERELAQFHRIQAAESLHIPKILSGEFQYEGMNVPYYVTYLLSPLEKSSQDARKKLLSPPYIFGVFYSLLKALEDLSYGFIIHNDIKPDNIMFCKDVPMLVDFGVSKSYSEINELELWKKRGYLHGTPLYLPPEVIQLENHPDGEHIVFCLDKVSQRMDIWALGLTFMEWLSGYRIFHDVSLGSNILEMLGKMQHLFSDGYIAKYKEQCLRKLTRIYLGTDVLTQQRMKDYDILEFYDKKYVHKQKIDVEDIEVKKTFLNDIFKVFDLCTLPYDKRPKAPQLLEELHNLFPQAKEKYDSLYFESITPPLEKAFLRKLNVESFKKTYFLLKGRKQYEAKRDGGWQCMNKRYDQWVSFTTIFNDFFASMDIKTLEGPDKKDLLDESVAQDAVKYQLFPFDIRHAFCHNLVKRDKTGLLEKIGQDVPSLVLSARHSQEQFSHFFATRHIPDSGILSSKPEESAFLFPLYVLSGEDFICNLSPLFISILEQELEWEFTTEAGDLEKSFNHENAFHYIYAILHSPIFRSRYSKHFQNEFCRIPVINQKKLFRQVSLYGKDLLALHLMEAPSLSNPYVSCPVTGHNKVEEKYLRYVPATESKQGRVYINDKQYFEGIGQQVWDYRIGIYQVCYEFLKNRLGISLDYEELAHYQKMVFSIQETLRIMENIDKTLLTAWSTVSKE